MPSLVLARAGFTIRVDSPDPADLEWLEENLEPGFQPHGSQPPSRCVAKIIDPARHRALLERGPASPGGAVPCFGFDGHRGACLRWSAPAVTLYDEELRVFYVIEQDGARVDVVAPSAWASTRIALFRLVREFTTHHLVARGSVQLHAAALAHEDRGILIVGPRRAGKTSLLIHGLAEPGSRFIANDRAMVSVGPPGEWRLDGMPTVISIRPGTVELLDRPGFPAASGWAARMTLAEALATTETVPRSSVVRPIILSPRQFCHAAGAIRSDSAPLQAIVFPRVDTSREGLHFERLSPTASADRLRRNLLHPADTVFCAPPPPCPIASPARSFAEGHAAVPAMECILGRRAFAEQATWCALFASMERTRDSVNAW